MSGKKINIFHRIAKKVIAGSNKCLVWSRSCDTTGGYGQIWYGNKNRKAHVLLYELMVGKVPYGLELDHLCKNPSCVNWLHVEPVTHKINVLRGNGISAMYARRTHCNKGHELSEENTYKRKGGRGCIICKRADRANYYHNHK